MVVTEVFSGGSCGVVGGWNSCSGVLSGCLEKLLSDFAWLLSSRS